MGPEEVVTAVVRLFFFRDGDGCEVIWRVGVFSAKFYGFVEGEPVLDAAIRIPLLFRRLLGMSLTGDMELLRSIKFEEKANLP